VAFATDRVGVALDAPDEEGRQRVEAFVSDGEPGGDAEWFEGTAEDGRMRLRSPSGKAALDGTV
jgi:hypothetical protein